MEVPQFSNGWFHGFKKRHGIQQRIRHGQSGDVDEIDVAQQLVAVQAMVHQYYPSDVYNCDETGLFWKSTPDRGLATQQISGTKSSKARITAHFTVNADGSDKMPIWFIGTAANPRCFGAAHIKISSLNCVWMHNKKAWMNTVIMMEYLQWFDRKMEGRKVLLLMDNYPAHEAAVEAIRIRPLSNTVICWLPPNSTSKTQPLDRGITASFKRHYRKRWVQYMIQEFDAERQPLQTMNVLKAIRWSIMAWSAVSTDTIIHCWQHSGLIPRPSTATSASTSTSTSTSPNAEAAQTTSEVTELINELQRQNRIASAINIQSFLNSIEEQVKESNDELDQSIIAQFGPQREYESDEELEVIPRIPSKVAIQLLEQLQLYEEQQDDGDIGLLQQLYRHRSVLYNRYIKSLQQRSITAYFGGQ